MNVSAGKRMNIGFTDSLALVQVEVFSPNESGEKGLALSVFELQSCG